MQLKHYLTIGIALGFAFSIGRLFGPKSVEVKEVEKVVYKERQDKDREQNVRKTEKETRLPDGTVIKERTETKETETHTRVQTETSSERTLERSETNRSDWLVSVGYEPAIKDIQDVHYSLSLQRRIVGELYLGVSARDDKTAGLTVSLGF